MSADCLDVKEGPGGEEVPPRPPWGVHIALFCLAGAACVGVRLAFPSDPMTWDDSYYLERAERIAAGQPVCFMKGWYMQYRLGLVLPLAAGLRLFGTNMFSFLLVGLGYAFAEGGFCYLAGRRLAGWPVGLAAALLLAVHPISVQDGSLVLPDHALNAWFTLTVWALLRTRAARRQAGLFGWGMAAGAFFFLGYVTRLTMFFLAPAVLLVPRRPGYWLVLVGMAAAFAIGWTGESALHFAYSGNWLNRLVQTGDSYEFWFSRLKLDDWWQLLTRWSTPFRRTLGWEWILIGAGALTMGLAVLGAWRGRLLAVWFLVPTLVVLLGFHSVNPPVALLHQNVCYFAMTASAAALAAAWAGAALAQWLAGGRRRLRTALWAAGTFLLIAAGIYVLYLNQRTREDDAGHTRRLAAAIDAQCRQAPQALPVYANGRAELVVKLTAPQEAKRALRPLAPALRRREAIPPDCLVLADTTHLRSLDLKAWQRWLEADPSSRPAAPPPRRMDRVAWPPAHWEPLEGAWIRGLAYYLLYRVHDPAGPQTYRRLLPLSRRREPGYWQDGTLAGWFLYPPRSAANRTFPIPGPGDPPHSARALRFDRRDGAAVFLLGGDSPELGNLEHVPGRPEPQDVDRVRVRPGRIYQVRFRVRMHCPGGQDLQVAVRVHQFGRWHRIPAPPGDRTFKVPVLGAPAPEDLPQDLSRAELGGPWQAQSLTFRPDERAEYIRVGVATNRPAVLDLADVELWEFGG